MEKYFQQNGNINTTEYEEPPVENAADAEEYEYYDEEPCNESAEEIEYYDEEEEYTEEYTEDDFEAVYAAMNAAIQKAQRIDGASRGRRSASKRKTLQLSTMDIAMVATGVVVLVLIFVVGGMFLNRMGHDRQVEGFESVGSSLDGIVLPGDKGIHAVADAQLQKKEEAEQQGGSDNGGEEKDDQGTQGDVENPDGKEDDNIYANATKVSMTAYSVQKDIKVKFSNQKTGELISGIPFSITLTDAEGKVVSYEDEDLDGIIYQANLTPGQYLVKAQTLADRYKKDYAMISSSKRLEIKKNITYAKVDIVNELKTEAQVDVQTQDTRTNETAVESMLLDTVAWVESTRSLESYKPIDKSTIPDPSVSIGDGTATVSARTGSGADLTSDSGTVLRVGASAVLKVPEELAGYEEIVWSSSHPLVVAVESKTGEIKAMVEGSADITYTATRVVEPETDGGSGADAEGDGGDTVGEVSGGDVAAGGGSDPAELEKETVTGTVKVAVVGPLELVLEQPELTVYIGTPVIVNAAVTNALVEEAKRTEGFTVASSDATIAVMTVDAAGVADASAEPWKQSFILRGLKEGVAVITVSYTEDKQEVKAVCTVTVKTDPKLDKANKLKDADGKQVYVAEGKGYREAYLADYYTADRFYGMGEGKYTGWQLIDGKVYYYDADGKRVTGYQVIQTVAYHFDEEGALITGGASRGINVSKWNGNIDWETVKLSGIDYAMIRCGYRGAASGPLVEDPNFKTNMENAMAAGLKVGVYFTSQAVSETEAVEEASAVLELVKNYKLSYPVFVDVEAWGGRAGGLDKDARAAVAKAFCETVQAGGYTAGIFGSEYWFRERMNMAGLDVYKIWLAQYAVTPSYNGRYDMWQYQGDANISGIGGGADMNWSYLGY